MRRLHVLCLALTLIMAHSPQSQGSERCLAAYSHSHGQVKVVLKSQDRWQALEALGADFVGFEHGATTADDRAPPLRRNGP